MTLLQQSDTLAILDDLHNIFLQQQNLLLQQIHIGSYQLLEAYCNKESFKNNLCKIRDEEIPYSSNLHEMSLLPC